MSILSKLSKLINYIIKAIYSKIDHVGYARYIGVNIRGHLFIYDNPIYILVFEPYFTVIGDNVHTANNVLNKRSLHLRHIKGKKKDIALKEYFHYRTKP